MDLRVEQVSQEFYASSVAESITHKTRRGLSLTVMEGSFVWRRTRKSGPSRSGYRAKARMLNLIELQRHPLSTWKQLVG